MLSYQEQLSTANGVFESINVAQKEPTPEEKQRIKEQEAEQAKLAKLKAEKEAALLEKARWEEREREKEQKRKEEMQREERRRKSEQIRKQQQEEEETKRALEEEAAKQATIKEKD